MAIGAVDGWRTPLLVFLLALWLGTWVAAVINLFRSRFHRPFVRWIWLAVVTVVPLIGFLVYWAAGNRYKVKQT